jgi:hypothetical protein
LPTWNIGNLNPECQKLYHARSATSTSSSTQSHIVMNIEHSPLLGGEEHSIYSEGAGYYREYRWGMSTGQAGENVVMKS